MSDTPPEEEEDRRKKGAFVITKKQIVAGLITLLLVGGGIGLGLWLSGGGSKNPNEVFLQPTSQNLPNTPPFTPPAGHDASLASTPLTTTSPATPKGGIVSFSGNAVGLYGGTLNVATCNPQQLITYLTSNASLAAAWAGAEGISPSQIPTYIHQLTPMILRYDTRLTNHGYINGVANPIPEILQAGNAVLVDRYGVPRARCYCGNPLTPAVALTSPTYVGAPWVGFSPSTVAVIQPSPTIINNFTVINITNNTYMTQPAGTTTPTAPTAPTTPSTPTTTPPPTPTTTRPPTTQTTPPVTSATPTTAPQQAVPTTAPNGQTLGTGAVQITLTWSTTADLDLHAIEPGGTEIYYGNKTAADGGTLDVDSNGGCSNTTTSPVENIYWTTPPVAGNYTARVVYYSECPSATPPGTGPQAYTITIKVNGQTLEQRQATIQAAGNTQDYPFTVP